MKVCMITTSFPRFSGDYSGIFVSRLCESLAALNVKIDVVAPPDRNEQAEDLIAGSRVHRFTYFFPKHFQYLAYGPGGIPAKLKRHPWQAIFLPFFLLMFIWKTLRISKDADLIHANWLYSGVIACVVKMCCRKPFIVTLRGSDAKQGWIADAISHWVITNASFITTVNQDLKNWVVQHGISNDTVVVIRNGVDLNRGYKKYPADQVCRFIFVGTLVPRKGVEYLIQAFSLVNAVEKNTCLLIVGDGEKEEFLKAIVSEQNLENAVAFSGAKLTHEIPALMQESDCLVLPSLLEGIPNVILEAMACGLPVVASDLPGIREVVKDEETGFLVEPRDVENLAKKLLILVRNPERRQKMGERAYQSLSEMNLSWPQAAKQYLEVYRKVCAASQASSA